MTSVLFRGTPEVKWGSGDDIQGEKAFFSNALGMYAFIQ
jgi:hypothetical protein